MKFLEFLINFLSDFYLWINKYSREIMCNVYIQWTKEDLVLSRWNKISAVAGATYRFSVRLLKRYDSEEMKENDKYLLSWGSKGKEYFHL